MTLATIEAAGPRSTIRLHPSDNVVIANTELAIDSPVREEGIVCKNAVPAGHKLATQAIAEGAVVRRYGQVIGYATRPIAPGEHVHVHNCAVGALELAHEFGKYARPTAFVPSAERATFQGIVRPDGRVATRNFVGILTTVNCSATVARAIADHFRGDRLAPYPNVDGVAAFVHTTGCGMAGHGDGFQILQRTLAGYARHPNFAGLLLIGLGCEVNQGDLLLENYGLAEGPLFQTMTIQRAGGTRRAVDEGVARINAMLAHADHVKRQPVSAEHLVLGLQCGGSDGYSGITANPALGAAADLLVRHGGTAILSETPEIYGAEHLLTGRAESPEVAEKLLERIAWWEAYTARNGGEMDNNPSPGNKAGGITTILEKSLGAAAKGGSTNLVGVYEYAEPIDRRGFVFMDSPGYDPCSATGQIASGANVICFTTGRGSVFGAKPVPSIKLATNSDLYRRMADDMDIDCGPIAEGRADPNELGERIFERLLKVASGEKSKSEELGFGESEFTPWVIGAVM